jgi:hypothetical protein
MNLRKVTIWTTGVMLIGTIMVPCLDLFFNFLAIRVFEVVDVAFIWLFSGSPLAVSLYLTIKSRSHNSDITLLVSTIAYGVWYIFMLFDMMNTFFGIPLHKQDHGGTPDILLCGIFSLPVMLSAWGIALNLDPQYTEQPTAHPGTSAASSSPALSEGDQND